MDRKWDGQWLDNGKWGSEYSLWGFMYSSEASFWVKGAYDDPGFILNLPRPGVQAFMFWRDRE